MGGVRRARGEPRPADSADLDRAAQELVRRPKDRFWTAPDGIQRSRVFVTLGALSMRSNGPTSVAYLDER
jgi:hypothetical protein